MSVSVSVSVCLSLSPSLSPAPCSCKHSCTRKRMRALALTQNKTKQNKTFPQQIPELCTPVNHCGTPSGFDATIQLSHYYSLPLTFFLRFCGGFLMFIYLFMRGGRGRKRGTEAPKQTLRCQHRAQLRV